MELKHLSDMQRYVIGGTGCLIGYLGLIFFVTSLLHNDTFITVFAGICFFLGAGVISLAFQFENELDYV